MVERITPVYAPSYKSGEAGANMMKRILREYDEYEDCSFLYGDSK